MTELDGDNLQNRGLCWDPGDLSDAGNQAKVLEAYSAGHDAVVCTRARATSTEGRLLRVLTLVVRTDKHNGQVLPAHLAI